LGLGERLLNYEGSVVLFVDFSENETAAVYVDQDRKLKREGCGLKMCERYV
jgi:hypothetical protein